MKNFKRTLAVLLAAAMLMTASITAFAAEGDGAETQAATELTEQQQNVIIEMIEPYLRYILYRPGEWHTDARTSITNEELTTYDVVDRLYGILHDAYYDSAIVTPVEHDFAEYYSMWFDKDSALKNVGDIYGRTITDADIAEYNASRGEDMADLLSIDGNAISFMGADGESDFVIPYIDDYTIDGDVLTVSIPFICGNDYDDEIRLDHATAVFIANPDSFFGYTFESVALD